MHFWWSKGKNWRFIGQEAVRLSRTRCWISPEKWTWVEQLYAKLYWVNLLTFVLCWGCGAGCWVVLTALVMYVSGIQRCSSRCCRPYPWSVTTFSWRGSRRNIHLLSVQVWESCRSRFSSILAKFSEEMDIIVTSTSTSTSLSALFLYLGDISRHLILQSNVNKILKKLCSYLLVMSIVSTKLDAEHSDQAKHKRINTFDLPIILIFSITLPLCPLALSQSHTDLSCNLYKWEKVNVYPSLSE